MTILPDTIYEYEYKKSRFLTKTEPLQRSNKYWAVDFQRLSGTFPMLDHPWEFERLSNSNKSKEIITIIKCYDKQTYPEMYI